MSWATEDAELFVDALAEFGIVGGMVFTGRARDIIIAPNVVSFDMQGNNYDRQITRELIALRADNTDLVALWNASTPENRPVALVIGDKLQLMEMSNNEVGATVRFLGKLLQ